MSEQEVFGIVSNEWFDDLLNQTTPVAVLPEYTEKMWGCLVDYLSSELRICLPCLPIFLRELDVSLAETYLFSKHDASFLRSRLNKRAKNYGHNNGTMFLGYDVDFVTADEAEKMERTGFEFLTQLAGHIQNDHDWIAIDCGP